MKFNASIKEIQSENLTFKNITLNGSANNEYKWWAQFNITPRVIADIIIKTPKGSFQNKKNIKRTFAVELSIFRYIDTISYFELLSKTEIIKGATDLEKVLKNIDYLLFIPRNQI